MNSRTRVLILSRRWPPFCGGAERQLELGARHLASGLPLCVIAGHQGRTPPAAPPLVTIKEPALRGASTLVFIFVALARGLAFRPTVVLANQLNETALLARLISLLTGARLIIRLSAFGQVGNIAWARKRTLASLYLSTLKRAWRIVVSTESFLGELREAGVADGATRIIPNMVEDPGQTGTHPDPATLLWCGRMDDEKDPLLALDALASASCPKNLRLRVCGTGALEERVRARVQELGLQERVILEGFMRDPLPLMRTSSALLFTSLEDAMPNVILEAMAAGLPVIATRTDGSCRLVEDGVTGWLAPDRNPETLGRLVARLAGDPELARKMGRQARDRVMARHGVKTVLPLWQAVLSGDTTDTIRP
ncbi:MAG: glycosyltransferase family 4 protein [Planctomycetota bacterium]